MYRLDKACDLSAFCDNESSRYALAAVRFRPCDKKELAKVYRQLRQPESPEPRGPRVVQNKKTKEYVNIGERYRGKPPKVKQMPAIDAYKQAQAQLRGRVEATNGRLAVSIPTLNGDEFPQTPGAGKEPQECLIPAEAIKNAIRQIPKGAIAKRKPVLGSVLLTKHSDSEVVLSTTNLERTVDTTERLIDARFPNLDAVWPQEPAEMVVTLDVRYLEDICKHFRQCGNPEARGIDIILRGPDKAVEFHHTLSDDRIGKAILMPLSRDKK